MSPGFIDGQEVCVHKGLTDYAQRLGVDYFIVQCWEGQGKDSRIVNYSIIDKNTKQVVFMDPRVHVCEYVLENIANSMKEESEVESS